MTSTTPQDRDAVIMAAMPRIERAARAVAFRWGVDRSGQDDAAQTAILAILELWSVVERARDPSAFIVGVARRRVRDAIRQGDIRTTSREDIDATGRCRRKGREVLVSELAVDALDTRSGGDPAPVAETRDLAVTLLAVMEPVERTAAVLFFGLDGGGDRTTTQVGVVMGLHNTNVGRRLRGGLGRAQEALCRGDV